MIFSQYDRVVIMSHDSRYPDLPLRTAQLLRDHGATNPQVFLNGHGRHDLDLSWYDLLHDEKPPSSWSHQPNAFHYLKAYRQVLASALQDGIENLLVCEDDIEINENFNAIMSRSAVPEDWQILSYHTYRFWESKPPESAGPYLIRLNGGQCGCQAVGWRREAIERFLQLPVDRPVDWMTARLHGVVPCYAYSPSVIRQAEEVASVIENRSPSGRTRTTGRRPVSETTTTTLVE